MKYLKVENSKGYYSLNGMQWEEIDKIDKDSLLSLLDLALNTDFTMDDYESSNLANQAHQIIYRDIYNKFNDILKNKQQFNDESSNLYKGALEKYKSA